MDLKYRQLNSSLPNAPVVCSKREMDTLDRWKGNATKKNKQPNYFLRVTPTNWHCIWHSMWNLFSHSIWQSFWHLFWHSIGFLFWRSIWHSVWHSAWHSLWHELRSSPTSQPPELAIWRSGLGALRSIRSCQYGSECSKCSKRGGGGGGEDEGGRGRRRGRSCTFVVIWRPHLWWIGGQKTLVSRFSLKPLHCQSYWLVRFDEIPQKKTMKSWAARLHTAVLRQRPDLAARSWDDLFVVFPLCMCLIMYYTYIIYIMPSDAHVCVYIYI